MSTGANEREAMTELLRASDVLCTVLGEENQALVDHSVERVRCGLDGKRQAVEAYEKAFKQFSERATAALDSLSAPERKALSATAAKLRALMNENALRLQAATAGQRRFIDRIFDAVKTNTPGPGTYCGQGTVGQRNARMTAAPASMTFNQSL